MTEEQLIGVPTLMRMAFDGEDMSAIGVDLFRRINADKHDANALLDAASYLILTGKLQEGLAVQGIAIQTRQVYEYPRDMRHASIKLLLVLGPGDLMANSPLEFLIEGQRVALDLLYVTPELGFPNDIPEHDVLMVAVAESDANQALLTYLTEALKAWPKPVLNSPQKIAELSRDAVFAKLSNLPGVMIPSTVRVERSDLARDGVAFYLSGESYPIIIRPIDSHAGEGLEKIEDQQALHAYLAQSNVDRFFISKFVDYASRDGQYRKYRLMLIDGRAYVSHMAISARWMVHYLNSDMLEHADYRLEEKNCMENFDSTFNIQHHSVLVEMYKRFGLDYVGIDCAETKDGQLLIFEVDSNMVVHNMDSAEMFPYKKVQMPKIFRAFSQLLESKKRA